VLVFVMEGSLINFNNWPGSVSFRKKGISSDRKKWVFTGNKTFLPGRNGRNCEETPKGHRVCDNNQLIW